MFECRPDGIKLKFFADDTKLYASLTNISVYILNCNYALIILHFDLRDGNCHLISTAKCASSECYTIMTKY